MRKLKGTVGELDALARKARSIIVRTIGYDKLRDGMFQTPQVWAERGERYGTRSVLVLVHDGNDLARYCNFDCYDYPAIDRLDRALRKAGLYVECCTSWYSAVYPVGRDA